MSKIVNYIIYACIAFMLLVISCNYFKGNSKFQVPDNYDINLTEDTIYWKKSFLNCFN